MSHASAVPLPLLSGLKLWTAPVSVVAAMEDTFMAPPGGGGGVLASAAPAGAMPSLPPLPPCMVLLIVWLCKVASSIEHGQASGWLGLA